MLHDLALNPFFNRTTMLLPIRHLAFVWITGLLLMLAMLAPCRLIVAAFPGNLHPSSVGCLTCHQLELDDNHRLPCISCHRGNDRVLEVAEAHRGLVSQPAHPDNAPQYCGSCHERDLHMVQANYHYTLQNHIADIREAFVGTKDVVPPMRLTVSSEPANARELADDLLRRRCLRCHVYFSGDDFAQTRRGTGCAACHLRPQQLVIGSHHFLGKPTDDACLSCHYGNHVGFDFYGRYEHDFNEEYRTPFASVENTPPPYGVEYHQLTADVHHRAGMVCIDCHGKDDIMGPGSGPTCTGCHENSTITGTALLGVIVDDEQRTFVSSATSQTLIIPQLQHPAHQSYKTSATCFACHAKWTYNDGTINLLRIDHDYLDDFVSLRTDGSSRVYEIISSYIAPDGSWITPTMIDTFTGVSRSGIWIKGYLRRRWEDMLLIRDTDGRITTGRPVLDMRLSWIDKDESVRFDNIRPFPGTRLTRPYAPHTIGTAGVFFEERLHRFIADELSLDRAPEEQKD